MKGRKRGRPPQDAQQQVMLTDVSQNPGVIRPLSTKSMTVCQLPYQRPVREADVDKLIQRWDPCALGLLAISFRDGRYYVLDGQHRIAAVKKMNGGEDVMMLCIVYHGLTYEEEAALCYKLDKAQKHKTLPQAINVLLESKQDAEVLEIQRLIEDAGFFWTLGRRTGKVYEITATSAILRAYRILGGQNFSWMLDLTGAAWHGAPASVSAAMLSGLALFIKTYETELNEHTVIKSFAALAPDEIVQQAKEDYTTNRVALRVARVLLDAYNLNRGARALPYRFKD